MRRLGFIISFVLCCVQAQAADLASGMQQCLQLSQDQARLQCYDHLARQSVTPAAAVAATPTPVASAPDTPAAPAAAAVDPTQSFGLEKRTPKEQIADLQLVAKSVRTTAKGRVEITMENGQIWLQTDDSRFDVKPGDVCRIERAMMGSFLLDNGRSNRKIRVRRVD
jgi:hypothetical protein